MFDIQIGFHAQLTVLGSFSLGFFLIGAITDFFDGYLARKWDALSNFGKLYDPLVDKVLVLGILAVFVYQNNLHFLIPVLLIIRDICMDVIRSVIATQKIIMPASLLAKAKTMCQMLAVTFILLFLNRNGSDSESLEWYLASATLIPALFFSYVSFAQYIKKIWVLANNKPS